MIRTLYLMDEPAKLVSHNSTSTVDLAKFPIEIEIIKSHCLFLMRRTGDMIGIIDTVVGYRRSNWSFE